MEYLITSFHTVAPLLVLMSVGLLLRIVGFAKKKFFLTLNKVVYYVGLPCMMFRNIVGERETSSDWQVVAFMLGVTILLFVLMWIFAPYFIRNPKRRGAITQATVRSNDSIFSLTVAATMLPEGTFGLTIFTAALVATAYNILSIITLEINGGKIHPLVFLKSIVTNPVILSVAAGYLFRFLDWELPIVLQKPIEHFANMVPPVGFLTLGGILSFEGVRQNRKALTFITVCKLIVIPLLCTGTAALLGFRGIRLLTVLLISAAPTAMASYPLATALDSDADLAGEAVAVTTALSLPTVFLFLTAFGMLL